ncbi:MAG: ParA family protein [Sulfuritalea sp.]|nr:ParA family protein [Sulfuritalea sp.]
MRLVVFNQKGGVGKTTTALNLAAALARDSAPTLLVDLDPQAHLTAIHGKAPGEAHNSVFALYQDNRSLEELAVTWEGVGRLIPAHAELIKVDSIFGKGPAILNRLNTGLQTLEAAGGESIAMIDCCPFLGVLSLNAIFAADRILVPVSSDYLSLRGALQIGHTLKALEPVIKRRIERRYLLTRFDRRRKMSFDIQDRLRAQFGAELCETVISENVAIAEAPALSLDIFTHNASCRGALDYLALMEELRAARFL